MGHWPETGRSTRIEKNERGSRWCDGTLIVAIANGFSDRRGLPNRFQLPSKWLGLMKKVVLISFVSLAGVFLLSLGCDRGEVADRPPVAKQPAEKVLMEEAAIEETPIEAVTTTPPPGPADDETPPAVDAGDSVTTAAADKALETDKPRQSHARMLPSVDGASDESDPPATDPAADAVADTDAAKGQDLSAWSQQGPTGEEIAREAFLPPPGGKSLSKHGRLWIDPEVHRVYLDGYVTLKRGPLEMFACPVGTKEHESIVAALARSREVHAALLAVGADSGTPVRFDPEFLPPTGQVVRIYVCWYDAKGDFHASDARQWIEDLQTEKPMTAEWVFAGSGFWQDPEDQREYYLADSGDMICVSNFSSAMLDVAIPSSADTGSLRFVPMEDNIPELDTPVRLVMVPVPNPADDPQPAEEPDLLKLPESSVVPRKK